MPVQLQLQRADILPCSLHEFTMGTSTQAMYTHMYAHTRNQINGNKRRTQAEEWQGTHCTFGLRFNWQQRSKPKKTPREPTAHLLEWPLSKKTKTRVPITPALSRLRQEDQQFGINLDYIANPAQSKQTNNKTPSEWRSHCGRSTAVLQKESEPLPGVGLENLTGLQGSLHTIKQTYHYS